MSILTILVLLLVLLAGIIAALLFSRHKASRAYQTALAEADKKTVELERKNRKLQSDLDLQKKEITHVHGVLDESINKFNHLLEGAAEVGKMTEEQKEVLKKASETIHDIAGTMADLVAGMNSHVCSFEESTDTLREIAAGTEAVGAITEESNDVAALLEHAVIEGNRTISKTMEAIGSIEESSQTVASSLKEIASISARTNMLAMNAAIEAAHAGDSGRGFAVVASEVRALAENSSRTVNTIAGLVSSMTERVTLGVELSRETVRLFGEISSGIEKSRTLAASITEKVTWQNKAVTHVLPEIERLVSQICTIQSLSDGQKERSSKVQNDMKEIADSSEGIRMAEKALVEEDFEILELLEKSRNICVSLTAQ